MKYNLENHEFNYVFHQFDYLFKDMDGARFHEGEIVGVLHGAKIDGITPGADYIYRFIQGLQERVRLEKERSAHQKMKRCEKMWHFCAIKALYEIDYKGNPDKWRFYSKWMHKWFELAKHFRDLTKKMEVK